MPKSSTVSPAGVVSTRATGRPREPGTEGADPGVTGYLEVAELDGANAALRTFGVDLEMVPGVEGADIVHSHTWYANLAGHLSGMLYGIPHILSAHSLEPMRLWKAKQLGGRVMRATALLREHGIPFVANQPCHWRDNWHTRGTSIPVLSY